MSVIIQDIEMPKSCFDCPCHDGEWGRCNITNSPIGLCDNERPQDCPLKEVEPIRHAHFISEVVIKKDWNGKPRQYYQPNACSYCHTALRGDEPYCSNCGSKMDEEVEQ